MSRIYESEASKNYVWFMKQDLKQYVNWLSIRSNSSIKINSSMKKKTNIKYIDKTKERYIYNSKH